MLTSLPATELNERLWSAASSLAVKAGLDVTKFGDAHRQLVTEIAAILAQPRRLPPPEAYKPRLRWFAREDAETELMPAPITPIIVSGVPGTGKTTYLSLLDAVLRGKFGLPDGIRPVMTKRDGKIYTIQKREICGQPISLLSVSKLSRLLHFYAWDTTAHGFDAIDLDTFIYSTLAPMRIVFADEIEMTGFSPTIPDLATRGILVIGSSNQTRFEQLEKELVPPRILEFGGDDMRSGDPADAVVRPGHPVWPIFEALAGVTHAQYEFLTYSYLQQEAVSFIHLDFAEAIHAPLLETKWVRLFQAAFSQANGSEKHLGLQTPLILLLDNFSLDVLSVNYNAAIRFIALFDAVEQHGLGAFVRHAPGTPHLSYDAIEQLKQTIRDAPIANIKLKQSTLSGIDRWTSRLGQAAHRARGRLQLQQ